MSDHVFHDIFLHITWHTKNDLPLIKGDFEQAVYQFVCRRCTRARGVHLHGIGGTENHLHLALSIEPFVSISDLVGELKGASAREVNKQRSFKALHWQRGFGVVSFGRKNLQFVLKYIEDQKEHHAKGTTRDRLERTGTEGGSGREGTESAPVDG